MVIGAGLVAAAGLGAALALGGAALLGVFSGATTTVREVQPVEASPSSASQITAIAPPGNGIVDVRVTIPTGGISAIVPADHFTYVLAPNVTAFVLNGMAAQQTVDDILAAYEDRKDP